MVTISIGSSNAVPLQEASDGWIAQQVNRRREQEESVCVRIVFKEPDIDVTFATPECGGGGSLGRTLTAKEQRILELWRKHHLDAPGFTGGNVVAFAQQLRSVL
jgi:hypothetical protein